MEAVCITGIIAVCLTVVIVSVINNWKELTNYYHLCYKLDNLEHKLDKLHFDFYNNEIQDKVNELYNNCHAIKSKK